MIVVSPKTNRRRRRRNAPVMRRRNRHYHRRRRNPELFGQPLFGKNSLELVGGGLLGLVAAKFIPTLIPTSITGGLTSSSVGRTVVTAISAVVGAWAGSKVSPQLGQGMLFGGMIQTASVALNAFLPSVYGTLNPSLGDLLPGQFPVPQNPIRAGIPAPAAAAVATGSQNRIPMSGLARAYGATGAY